MKKGITAILMASGFFALTMVSCGEQFTPLSEEEISAKVEEGFNEVADSKRAEFEEACQTDWDAKVAAKVAELQNESAL